MEETLLTEEKSKRPGFLTTLCILSFIGSGGMGLKTLYDHFTFHSTYDNKVEQLQNVMDQLGDNQDGWAYKSTSAGLDNLEIMSENLTVYTSSNLLFAILSVIAVIMMFRLKKNGFYLYSVANMFWLLVPLYFFGFATTNLLGVGISAFFTLLFIIFYSVNLKHMR